MIIKEAKNAYQKLNLYLKNEDFKDKVFREESFKSLEDFVLDYLKDFSSQSQQRVLKELNGFGPLENLLNDPDVDEILINGPQAIAFEKHGKLYEYEDHFFSEYSLVKFVDLIAKSFFKAISYENPTGNGRWGPFRVHIISPPLTPKVCISLRRQGVFKIKSLEDLIKIETLKPEHLELLNSILKNKSNILIAGATSSGKTTFIQCLLNHLGPERCLIIEDTQELELPNALSSQVLCPTRQEQYSLNFTMGDLVKEALRMRPDRLILGEARGSEAKDYLQALSTGHRGCIASIHAAHPKEALHRLECLILQGAPQWPLGVVRQLISTSIDYIFQLSRQEGGRRRLVEVQKLSGLEENGLLLEPLF